MSPLLPAQDLVSTAAAARTFTEPLTILYRDEDLIAVYKPAGWLVHRSAIARHEKRFVLQRLRDQIGQHLWPVHRLDQGTCGVLVFALNKDCCQLLAQDFAQQKVSKHYLALVRGWLPAQVEVDYALRPEDSAPDAPAQPAQTSLRCLATLDWPESYDARHASTRASVVLAQPHTGRRHQIRRHLKHESHPILGDATHGKGPLNRWWAQRLGGQRLWLHAHALQCIHPRTGEPLHLCADWRALQHVAEVQQWQQMLRLPGWQGLEALPASCGLACASA